MKTKVEFYEGQQVNIVGIIEEIESGGMPIRVRPIGTAKNKNRITFDLMGRYTDDDLSPSLFPISEFQFGEIVEVSDENTIWHRRRFLFSNERSFFTTDKERSNKSQRELVGESIAISAVPWNLCRKPSNRDKETKIKEAIKLLEAEGFLKDGKILIK